MDKYILVDGEPVYEPELLTWARWFETSAKERIVAQDTIGDTLVSTVFLGINHSLITGAPPILYETMIFGGPHDQYQKRSSTRAGALDRHNHAVALAKG